MNLIESTTKRFNTSILTIKKYPLSINNPEITKSFSKKIIVKINNDMPQGRITLKT